jgi:hypothetical protein
VGDHPLRSPKHRRLGGPLPRQLANATQPHLNPINLYQKSDAALVAYAVLIRLSAGYPPDPGRLVTRYAPVRHYGIATTVRLACIRPAASVHPEPGSNSPLYKFLH